MLSLILLHIINNCSNYSIYNRKNPRMVRSKTLCSSAELNLVRVSYINAFIIIVLRYYYWSTIRFDHIIGLNIDCNVINVSIISSTMLIDYIIALMFLCYFVILSMDLADQCCYGLEVRQLLAIRWCPSIWRNSVSIIEQLPLLHIEFCLYPSRACLLVLMHILIFN